MTFCSDDKIEESLSCSTLSFSNGEESRRHPKSAGQPYLKLHVTYTFTRNAFLKLS